MHQMPDGQWLNIDLISMVDHRDATDEGDACAVVEYAEGNLTFYEGVDARELAASIAETRRNRYAKRTPFDLASAATKPDPNRPGKITSIADMAKDNQ